MVGQRGKLTSKLERLEYMLWIKQAIECGATQEKSCNILGLSSRTYQRWNNSDVDDKRITAKRPEPMNKLSKEEKEKIINICTQDNFINLPPGQIVPILADQNEYIASESTFYRVLKENDMLKHRGRTRPRRKVKQLTTHIATKANEVWSWDISYLPGPVKGVYYYLYLIIDIYSRKIVGHEVHDCESAEFAAELVEKSVFNEQCLMKPLVLHSDNGSPMKAQTMLEKLYQLGITPSRSRPRVSNDNPFSESLFRTLKYCPLWPSSGFKTLEESRKWMLAFVNMYNNKHRHSAIKFVTPDQRHRGEDVAILKNRCEVYTKAKEKTPLRWSKQIRDWTPIGDVALNPENMQRQDILIERAA